MLILAPRTVAPISTCSAINGISRIGNCYKEMPRISLDHPEILNYSTSEIQREQKLKHGLCQALYMVLRAKIINYSVKLFEISF